MCCWIGNLFDASSLDRFHLTKHPPGYICPPDHPSTHPATRLATRTRLHPHLHSRSPSPSRLQVLLEWQRIVPQHLTQRVAHARPLRRSGPRCQQRAGAAVWNRTKCRDGDVQHCRLHVLQRVAASHHRQRSSPRCACKSPSWPPTHDDDDASTTPHSHDRCFYHT